jgi:hypothetical protein
MIDSRSIVQAADAASGRNDVAARLDAPADRMRVDVVRYGRIARPRDIFGTEDAAAVLP